MTEDWDADDYADPDLDDDDSFGFDCGLNPEDGQCALAGSEDCDWECPNRNGANFAGSRAWCRKYNELYYTEVSVARHALGLPNERNRAYRNYFVTGEGTKDYPIWMDIVSKKLAVRIDRRGMMGGCWLFQLTRQGAEQALKQGEDLDVSDFPPPAILTEGMHNG